MGKRKNPAISVSVSLSIYRLPIVAIPAGHFCVPSFFAGVKVKFYVYRLHRPDRDRLHAFQDAIELLKAPVHDFTPKTLLMRSMRSARAGDIGRVTLAAL